jgi:hypothetical protein
MAGLIGFVKFKMPPAKLPVEIRVQLDIGSVMFVDATTYIVPKPPKLLVAVIITLFPD